MNAPPLFSKREKYSLAMFSVAFVAFSGAVHMMAGSLGSSFIPHFTVEPTPSPPPFYLLPPVAHTPRPTPTPPPRPTPTPTPPKLPSHPPAIHVPKYVVQPGSTMGPTQEPYAPPTTPAVVASATPAVNPSVQPIASPTTPDGPIEIRDSTFTYRAPLEYPQFDIDSGREGTVVVLVTIGPDGRLQSASIAESSGDARLDAAALEAARASRYTPYLINGTPVVQQYKIEYEFRLNQ